MDCGILNQKFNLLLLYAFLIICSSNRVKAETYTITNHFEVYDPDSLTINLGDTILFQLDSFHNALEVNYSTWDSGFAISNGGFYIPFGGGTWIPDTAGSYYYVCELHAHDGMVGMVNVMDPSVIDLPSSKLQIALYPNPVTDGWLQIDVIGEIDYELTIINESGQVVSERTLNGNRTAKISLLRGVYVATIRNRSSPFPIIKKIIVL
jgi:plastocyanin